MALAIAPPNSSSFSVKVVLPASGCEMIAKGRRRKISSVRVLINPIQLLPERAPPSTAPAVASNMVAARRFAYRERAAGSGISMFSPVCELAHSRPLKPALSSPLIRLAKYGTARARASRTCRC